MSLIRLICVTACVALLGGFAATPQPAPNQIAFEWSCPVVREDSTPASCGDVAYYEISHANQGGSLPDDSVVLRIVPTVTTINYGTLWPSSHAFKIRAVDKAGVASAYSADVTVVVE